MTEAEFNEFTEEEMAEALHLPDEDPNIVDPDDTEVEVLDDSEETK